jgi:hypothetical protein
MSAMYSQHEYTVNQPWSMNSTNSEGSVLEGDEELLILDQPRLGFDDDFTEEDYCRCVKCVSANGIAMISNGNIMDNESDLGHNQLEPTNTHSHYHHNYKATDDAHDHNWTNHCHPNSIQDNQSRAVKSANRKLLIGCLLCLIFMLGEFLGGYYSKSLAIMTGNCKQKVLNIN